MEEFNVVEFLKYYLSKLPIVIVFIILGILGSWYYTDNIQVPIYKSETSIVLANQTTDITVNDVSLNKNLLPTYREIIKSRSVLSKVIDNLDLDFSVEELGKKISVENANEAEIIVIAVKDEDRKLAKKISNEIADIFKDEVTNYYPIENVNILDYAVAADEPYNINILKQYVIGFGLGFILGSGIILLVFYFDDSIKSLDDIENKVNLSVLAAVPKYKPKNKKNDEEEE